MRVFDIARCGKKVFFTRYFIIECVCVRVCVGVCVCGGGGGGRRKELERKTVQKDAPRWVHAQMRVYFRVQQWIPAHARRTVLERGKWLVRDIVGAACCEIEVQNLNKNNLNISEYYELKYFYDQLLLK